MEDVAELKEEDMTLMDKIDYIQRKMGFDDRARILAALAQSNNDLQFAIECMISDTT